MQMMVPDTAGLAERYSGFVPPALSYGTVRDFCDSMDHLRDLASCSGDLKDEQRPWMVKAILGSLPRGSRLLEIGAGHPYVASLLTRLGYDVTIVDPYDGSGNGPQEYEYFSSSCPAIRFVREVFHAETRGLEATGYDAIYSISVLEHVPMDALPGLCSGIKRFLAPTGRTIHAIDHVLEGVNDGYHTEHLGLLFEHLGLSRARLAEVLEAARGDLETYFLSAEAHNRWRGTIPYEQFPMRRVISVQLNLPRASI